MRKIAVVFGMLFLLASCSVQEKVSPEIICERLCAADENISFDGDFSFAKDGVYTCYITYSKSLVLVAEMNTDGQGNVKKINLACDKTDKADLFEYCVRSMIEVYSPDENSDEISDAIFREKESDGKFCYHETQWYRYSAVRSENGLFFSTENLKLSPRGEEKLSLRTNDVVEYQNSLSSTICL